MPVPHISSLVNIFPHESYELIKRIEISFSVIHYELYIHDIEQVLLIINSDNKNIHIPEIFQIYREHILSVLSRQGIHLTHPFSSPLGSLVLILEAVNTLAVVRLSEILDGTIIEESCSTETYLAEILNVMTGMSVIEILHLIDYVSNDVISYLHQDIPIEELSISAVMVAKKRFMDSPFRKQGVVVDIIKESNSFGYNVDAMLKAYAEEFDMLKNALQMNERTSGKDNLNTFANELCLLVLGSSVTNDLVVVTILDLIPHLISPANLIVGLTSIVHRKMEYFNAN